MHRIIEPEILDELKPGDPRAIRARRDLQRINFWMRNAGLFRGALRRNFAKEPPRRIVEIGTGDGSLFLAVAKKMPWQKKDISITLVDREPAVPDSVLEDYRNMGWRAQVAKSDIFEWIKQMEPNDCMVANLFLHHFSEEQLRFLFSQAALKTSCFVACEPSRSKIALAICRYMSLGGIGEVASYDSALSIRAGFWDKELSRLWPQSKEWQLEERSAGVFSHHFVARKRLP